MAPIDTARWFTRGIVGPHIVSGHTYRGRYGGIAGMWLGGLLARRRCIVLRAAFLKRSCGGGGGGRGSVLHCGLVGVFDVFGGAAIESLLVRRQACLAIGSFGHRLFELFAARLAVVATWLWLTVSLDVLALCACIIVSVSI